MMDYSLKGGRYNTKLFSVDDKMTETACPEAREPSAQQNRFIALPFSLLSSPSKLARHDGCSLEHYCTYTA